jgi:hypothetical protein
MAHCCFKPCRLVLMPNKCFYCGCTKEILTHEVEHRNNGILTCKEHEDLCIRDIKADLHKRKHKIVFFHDILKYSEMIEFKKILGNNIQVIRSNGEIDNDWTFATIINDNPAILTKNKDNWKITVVKDVIQKDAIQKDAIQKDIYFSDFLNDKLKYYQIENFENILNKLIALLDNGIYKEYFNEQNGMIPQKYIDKSCLTVPVIINGMITRIVI